mmetsp:Transcript_61933/g.178281  ORF Transcript_61933/g.178281 Transcript_61933/m.178281 type:complete len:241 (+) Transcript_61933:318-1040(+)
MRPNDHLASDDDLLPPPLGQPLLLQPPRGLVGVALPVLLDAKLPDGAVLAQLFDAGGDVVDRPPSELPPVLAQLPLHALQHQGGVRIAGVVLQQQLQVLLTLVPQRVGKERLRSSVQSLLVAWLAVQHLVCQLLDSIPLASLDKQLGQVIPEDAEERVRLRRQLPQRQQHGHSALPILLGLVEVASLEGFGARPLERGLHAPDAEGFVASEVPALHPRQVRGLLFELPPPIVLFSALLLQ